MWRFIFRRRCLRGILNLRRPDLYCCAVANKDNVLVHGGAIQRKLLYSSERFLGDTSQSEKFLSLLDQAKDHILANRLDEADALLQSWLQANPLDGAAWFYNGHLQFLKKRISEAVDSFRTSLRLQPDNPDVYGDLGAALILDLRLREAEALLREALRRYPGNSKVAINLAKLMFQEARYDEAESQYRSVLSSAPDSAEAIANLSAMLIDLHRPGEACEILQRFLKKQPEHLSSLSLLALALDLSGKLNEALSVVQRSIELSPPKRLDMILASYASLVGRLGRLDLREHVLTLMEKAIPSTLPDDNQARWLETDANALKRFSYLFPYYGVNDRDLLKVHRALAVNIAARRPAKPQAQPAVSKRLRIGFISYNFGNHPIGHLLSVFFEAHGHEQTELFLYSLKKVAHNDGGYRARIRKTADHFRDCHQKTDKELEEIIRADGLHILIDLDGYLYGGRPEILSTRPACIQIHWLQSLAGMPAPFIDYTIVDKVIVPTGERHQGNGPLIRLADAFQCGEKFALPQTPPSRESQLLPREGFVYCAFGNWLKIDQEVFSCWMEILKNVPDSVLWLSDGPSQGAATGLCKMAEIYGVDPKRLIIAQRAEPKVVHIQRHLLADLFLDTFTFSAATTATDALSAGLPVLTKMGATAQSRLSESLIRATGVTELIVPNKEEYIKTAIRLARNPKALEKHRKAQTKAIDSAALFDAKRMVRQFELIYAAVWGLHSQGKKPQHIDLDI